MEVQVQILAQTGTMTALVAVGLIAIGFVLGSIAASIARRLTSGASSPEVVRSSAGAIATLAFSIVLIVALVVALGVINQTALDQLLTDVALFLPRAISAAIVVIGANIVANFAEAGVARSLGHVSHTLRERVPSAVKTLILGFALVIAANQLGINTNVVLIAVGAIFFGVAGAAALLAGFGGRPVAQEIAAGRAIRRELKVGDTVRVGQVEGEIAAIGSTSTQITASQRITLVPNTELLGHFIEVVQDQPKIQLAPSLDHEDAEE